LKKQITQWKLVALKDKSMECKRFILNITILDYVWKPFFKVMKYNKPIGKIYNIFIGKIFINFIILKNK